VSFFFFLFVTRTSHSLKLTCGRKRAVQLRKKKKIDFDLPLYTISGCTLLLLISNTHSSQGARLLAAAHSSAMAADGVGMPALQQSRRHTYPKEKKTLDAAVSCAISRLYRLSISNTIGDGREARPTNLLPLHSEHKPAVLLPPLQRVRKSGQCAATKDYPLLQRDPSGSPKKKKKDLLLMTPSSLGSNIGILRV
jgi:hypothetical protein